MSVPALQTTVVDLIDEYDEKNARLDAEIAAFQRSMKALEMSATVQGHYVEPILQPSPIVSESRLRKNLLQSGWRRIYHCLNIDRLASAKDKQKFERSFQDPPALTFENARATFGDYLLNARFHILRGLAEVFADLDPAFKSHSKVQIGAKGLPKRAIITGFGGYGEYGKNKLRDIINAMAAYRGQPLMEQSERTAIYFAHRAGEDAVLDGRSYTDDSRYAKNTELKTHKRGITIRLFQNGNAHVFFDQEALKDINRALAEFYGDVLPDVEDDDVEARPSTEVAKDLQFYWSPDEVIAKALEFACVHPKPEREYDWIAPIKRVLEPSCGDGRMLDLMKGYRADTFGIEVHPGRAAQARAKGHSVMTANFLEVAPTADFDAIVMNPPFYGRHYIQHVEHALKFLKPDGILVTVLPATAHYDHKAIQGEWQDLPVASFAASGTNVPTGLLRIINRVEVQKVAA